jgi:Asp-tRNA(Asn)/Glu-tRNA(Gln) amidotransferase A subunit family amidase
MVPAAHASDGGGSIRVPSAFCGLFGLKPSRGRVPAGPNVGEAWSGLATTHAISRSVRDSAALLDAVAGPEPGDPYAAPPRPRPYRDEVDTPPGALRLALMTAMPGIATAEPCREAVEDTARLCESLGHEVEVLGPEIEVESFTRAFLTVVSAHTADDLDALGRALGREVVDDELARLTAHLRAEGRRRTAADLARARTQLQRVGRTLGEFFTRFDALLAPTTAQPPVPLGYLNMDDPEPQAEMERQIGISPFTQLANATGCPSMSVPLGWSPEGLPLGSLVTAAYGREDLLFRLAGQLEAARPWWHRRPSFMAAV